jgi:hypothetical protein
MIDPPGAHERDACPGGQVSEVMLDAPRSARSLFSNTSAKRTFRSHYGAASRAVESADTESGQPSGAANPALLPVWPWR